jgi:hypothetical protein
VNAAARQIRRGRPLGNLWAGDRVIVVGQVGSGKTHWTRTEIAAPAERCVVFDPAEDPQWLADGFRPWTVAELAAEPGLLAADNMRIVCHPRPGDFAERGSLAGAKGAEVETLCDLVRAAGDLVIVWDEVGDYDEEGADPLQRLARGSRHQGVAVVFVSQCAIEIPKRCRRQATRIVSFLQSEPSDLATLADKCGEAFANQARDWRKGQPPAVWTLPSLER